MQRREGYAKVTRKPRKTLVAVTYYGLRCGRRSSILGQFEWLSRSSRGSSRSPWPSPYSQIVSEDGLSATWSRASSRSWHSSSPSRSPIYIDQRVGRSEEHTSE